MKKCPQCNRDYNDDSLSFCLDDGAELLFGAATTDEPATAILGAFGVPPSGGPDVATRPQIQTTASAAEPKTGTGKSTEKRSFSTQAQTRLSKLLAILGVVVLVLIGGFFSYRYFAPASSKQIESIAV